MRVAFVTTYDPSDVHHWSGLGFFIARALSANGMELVNFGPLAIDPFALAIGRAKGLWHNRIRRRRYFRNHDALFARRYARMVDRRLRERPDIELIFSPGTVPVAFLQDRRPLALWSDATHARMFDFYAEYTGISAGNRRDGHRIEQTALDRSAAAMFASDWAAASAINDYHAPAQRVHVVPFGANLEHAPTDESVARAIEQRPRDKCRLLFLGVDWERKGGPFAVEVAAALNRAGIDTELTVAGCDPFAHGAAPPFVRLEGFLSKGDAAGNERLQALLREHHFLIVPSIAECYGLVYCEANAFGMPALARDTGGVSTIIRDGENGRLFPIAAPASEFAQAVGGIFSKYDRYLTMARQARRHFQERLNWDVAGRTAAEILRRCPAFNPLPR